MAVSHLRHRTGAGAGARAGAAPPLPRVPPPSKRPQNASRGLSFSSIFCITFFALLFVVFGLFFSLIIIRNGGFNGRPFPDRSTEPKYSDALQAMEVVARLPSPAGNVAVDDDGRVFFTFHPMYNYPIKVAEVTGTESFRPYPTSDQSMFTSVLSVRLHQHKLYTLDFARYGMQTPRIMCFNTHTDSLEWEYAFNDVEYGSMLNDFNVSPDGEWIYIADTSLIRGIPKLIVLHVPSMTHRFLLKRHPAVIAQNFTLDVEGVQPRIGPFVLRPHVDSITLDAEGKWLYFAPLAHEHIFRIETRLIHSNFTDDVYNKVVEKYSDKTISDGITIDNENNIYLTDIEHSAVAVIDNNRKLYTLVRDPKRLRWPDGFSFGPNNFLYVTESCLHLQMSGQNMSDHAPFHILRMKALGTRIAGQ